MIDLITTFNEDIFNEYSKNLVDTFIEKTDKSLRLNIFYEGNLEKIKRLTPLQSSKQDYKFTQFGRKKNKAGATQRGC